MAFPEEPTQQANLTASGGTRAQVAEKQTALQDMIQRLNEINDRIRNNVSVVTGNADRLWGTRPREEREDSPDRPSNSLDALQWEIVNLGHNLSSLEEAFDPFKSL